MPFDFQRRQWESGVSCNAVHDLHCLISRAAAVCVAAVVVVATAPSWVEAAELPPELRAEVEALKQSARETPTDETNIAERARLMSDWMDAHAVAGEPGNPFEYQLRAYAVELPERVRYGGEDPYKAVDDRIEEYRIRDEEPEALGQLRAESLGPFIAGSHDTIVQHWTAGSRGMDVGGGIWLARHFAAEYGTLQTDDPAAQGYVSITTSDDDARFTAEIITAYGPHGGFRDGVPAAAFRLTEGRVDPGETVSITFGDTSGGGPGLKITPTSGENVPLPLYVALDADSPWMLLPLQPFVIDGAGVAGVHGFATSVVAPGEAFTVSVRAQDQFYNRATGPIPAFELWLNGEKLGETRAGTDAIQELAVTLDKPGAYWMTLRSTDGAIEGTGNPVLVTEDTALRVYWGETHAHSGYAEGIGTIDYFMKFAREDARLDFVSHTEHDMYMNPAEWDISQEAAVRYDRPGEFITYPGYEWTVHAVRGGHHNVLFRTTENHELVWGHKYPTLSRLYQGLRELYPPEEVVIIPHAHNPGDSRQSDPLMEPLIEIGSMHGTFEWFLRGYLSNGHQVGFVAASDDHMSHPGYTAPNRLSLAQRGGLAAVLAPKRDRDAIFDGMRARRTYATTGDRMILDVRLNGGLMGERVEFSESRELTLRAIGADAIDTVTVYKNDVKVMEKNYLTRNDSFTDGRLQLAFYSDAEPKFRGDAPRGWRHWLGSFRLEGGTIESVEPGDFVNPKAQSIARSDDGFQFKTITRGDTSPIVLNVSGLETDARLIVDLEQGMEAGSAPPFLRVHQINPGGRFELPLRDMRDGVLSVPVPAIDYTDGIVLRGLVEQEVREVSLTYTDTEDANEGDYYYVRVRQKNGEMAWSSPIWVGGYPPQ